MMHKRMVIVFVCKGLSKFWRQVRQLVATNATRPVVIAQRTVSHGKGHESAKKTIATMFNCLLREAGASVQHTKRVTNAPIPVATFGCSRTLASVYSFRLLARRFTYPTITVTTAHGSLHIHLCHLHTFQKRFYC